MNYQFLATFSAFSFMCFKYNRKCMTADVYMLNDYYKHIVYCICSPKEIKMHFSYIH